MVKCFNPGANGVADKPDRQTGPPAEQEPVEAQALLSPPEAGERTGLLQEAREPGGEAGDGNALSDWPDPVPLTDRPPVAPFPCDVLPPLLARLVKETAGAIGVPPDFVGMDLLTVAGGLIGRSRVLLVKKGWEEAPSLYVATVGISGTAKSPVLNAVMEPVRRIEARLAKKHKSNWAEYERKKAKHRDDKGKDHPPVPPKRVRLTVDDFTGEALAEILAENPRGVLMAKDELIAWVAAMNQYRRGRGTDRQLFMSAWSGSPIQVDRKGRGEAGPLYVPHPFVAVVGNLPPDQIARLTDNGQHEGDGFVERILFVWPDLIPIPEEDPDNERVVSDQAERAWRKAAEYLFELPLKENTEGDLDAVRVKFSKEAKRLFWEKRNEHVAEMNEGRVPENLRACWSKLISTAARLTLILHLLKHAVEGVEAGPVGVDSVEGAWELVDYLKTHLRRVHGVRARRKEQKLVEWIVQKNLSHFKGREILAALPGQFKDAKEVNTTLATLEQLHYVRRCPARKEPGTPGRPPADEYKVNPKVLLGLQS